METVEKNKEIGKRIRMARDMRDMTLDDVASQIGVAKSTVQRYEIGTIGKIKIPVLQSIAQALDVNPSWLIGKSSEMILSTPLRKVTRIPVLGRVAAGIPIEAVEEIVDYEEITEAMARTGEFFGLRIQGDSMEPKISNGDTVIVKKQEDADDGDIVIALVNGNDAVCKRLKKYQDGSVALVSTNPAYNPLFFSGVEVNETPVKIIGKVKELRAKF